MVNVIPKQFYVENYEIKTTFEEDNKLKKKEIKEIVEKILGDRFENIDYYKGQRILTGRYNTEKEDAIYFMIANITFMGGKEGQHPKDLKRIQYNVRWRNFYNEYIKKGKVLWMGIYSYKDLNVFGVFEPETYLKKHEGRDMKTKSGKLSAYSCHIYLNDLLQGYENGIFDKKDKNDNQIWAISSNYLKDYFEGKREKNPIIAEIKKINNERIDWNRWIRADEAIPFLKELKSKTGINVWKENMWNGYLIEGIYSDYFYDYKSEHIEYLNTSKNDELKNEYAEYDLDLAFPNENNKFIGDLKNVCDGGGNALLNDESHVKAALNKYGKVWFVVYIHEKKLGKTNDYECVKWRNHYIKDSGEWKSNKKFNEKSAPGTPHSIKMVEMVVAELNEVTEEIYFSIKPQPGPNSNDAPRKDKYTITKRILKKITDDNLVIYRERHY